MILFWWWLFELYRQTNCSFSLSFPSNVHLEIVFFISCLKNLNHNFHREWLYILFVQNPVIQFKNLTLSLFINECIQVPHSLMKSTKVQTFGTGYAIEYLARSEQKLELMAITCNSNKIGCCSHSGLIGSVLLSADDCSVVLMVPTEVS